MTCSWIFETRVIISKSTSYTDDHTTPTDTPSFKPYTTVQENILRILLTYQLELALHSIGACYEQIDWKVVKLKKEFKQSVTLKVLVVILEFRFYAGAIDTYQFKKET